MDWSGCLHDVAILKEKVGSYPMFELKLINELGLSYALEEDYCVCSQPFEALAFKFLSKIYNFSLILQLDWSTCCKKGLF